MKPRELVAAWVEAFIYAPKLLTPIPPSSYQDPDHSIRDGGWVGCHQSCVRINPADTGHAYASTCRRQEMVETLGRFAGRIVRFVASGNEPVCSVHLTSLRGNTPMFEKSFRSTNTLISLDNFNADFTGYLTADVQDARNAHARLGGYLLRMGDIFLVCQYEEALGWGWTAEELIKLPRGIERRRGDLASSHHARRAIEI